LNLKRFELQNTFVSIGACFGKECRWVMSMVREMSRNRGDMVEIVPRVTRRVRMGKSQ
jgi:hypothetical protein